MQFGVSTHLYHGERLSRDHLVEIAAHGFEAVEIFATRTHFDYHDRRAAAALQDWLGDTGLRLASMHAPISASLVDGVWGPALSIAARDGARRAEAVGEIQAALRTAETLAVPFMIVHLGVPTGPELPAGGNARDAALRSLEELQAAAEPLGVRLALEVIPNELSSAAALVRVLEDELDLPRAGICLDFGHAFLMGDLVDAIEAASGHLITTHVHDNGGRTDDHLVPFEGRINWDPALMALLKIGYEGTLLLELANTSTPREVLEQARSCRARFERMLNPGIAEDLDHR
jgi:sugar phosphate isomerase/epimerase